MTIRGASPEPASREPASGATSAALHLLAPVAVFALLAGVVLALDGPSESAEGGLWAAALAVALPVGLLLLTTEILLRAGRRNVLPIANPIEDDLVTASRDRVRASVAAVRPGTLMLTSDPPPPGQVSPIGLPSDFVAVQVIARDALRRRFTWHPVASTVDGLRVVRLVARRL